MTPPSIALVIPYFGKLPNYFSLWLASCAQNPSIDWLLYTDDHVHTEIPENVKVHCTTFSDFTSRLERIFDFPIALREPYKLCDFKPVYGEALADELSAYDFWGYCDLDTIWGDLRSFLTDDILDSHDKVFTGGHLSVLRNSPQINALYRTGQPPWGLDYTEVLGSDASFAFDEWGPNHDGLNSIFLHHERSLYLADMPYADIKVKHHALRTNREDFSIDRGIMELERRKRNIMYLYRDGTILQFAIDRTTDQMVQREEAYVHLQKRPMALEQGVTTSEFSILPPNRFSKAPEGITQGFLEANCRNSWFYPQHYRIRYRNLKSKVLRGLPLP